MLVPMHVTACVFLLLLLLLCSTKNMWEHYGKTMAGFTRFVDEQLGGWYACLNGTTFGGLRGDGGPPTAR